MGQTSTIRTNQASNHKLVGDIVNIFVLAATFAHLSTVIYFTLPGAQGVVDEHWKKDGFCIQNTDVPYWSSFDTCLYVDVVFSIIIAAMYLAWKDIPGMEAPSAFVPAFIGSTLGHGIVHGAMAVKFRDGSYDPHEGSDQIVPTLGQKLVGWAIFWFPLLKATLPKMKNHHVAVLSALATYGQGFVKNELGFAYVQTIVNVAFHASQLSLSPEEKNSREYMMLPLMGILPIVVAWNEILFCDAFFRAVGGHVLYDASIAVSFMAFYLECYYFSTKSRSKALTKEKTS